MSDAGARVHYIPTIEEKLNDLFKIKSVSVIKNYYSTEFKKHYGKNITYLFQIRGENIDVELYTPFIKSGTTLIMYQWDSIKNFDYTKLIPYFNKSFSFDPADCLKFSSLSYFPMFHEIDNKEEQEDINDLLIVASFAYWRYKTIDRFYKLSQKYQLTSFMKLRLPLKTYVKFYASGKYINPKLLSIRHIKKSTYTYFLAHSKVIIDIPSPNQTGLTIRSLEAMAANKKLITTNKQIVNESFYSPLNTFILEDKFNEDLIMDFIQDEKKQYVNMDAFYINNWLLTIFC